MAVVAVLACAAAFAWWLWEMARSASRRREDLRWYAVYTSGVAGFVGFIWEMVAGASAAAILATLCVAGAVPAVAHLFAVDGRDLSRRSELLEGHLRDVERIIGSAERAGATQAQLTEATRQTIAGIRRSAQRRGS